MGGGNNPEICVVCKREKADIFDHVCGYGRCMVCFLLGSKIVCPWCKEHITKIRVIGK